MYRDHQCDGGQTEMAEIIVEQGADYVLALKDNQGQLFEDVQLLFDDLEQSDYEAYRFDYEKIVKEHGRLEIREGWTISGPVLLCHLLAGWQNDYLLKVLTGLGQLAD